MREGLLPAVVLALLLAAGCTSAELDRVLRVLDEPTTLVGSPVMISTWGRRPS